MTQASSEQRTSPVTSRPDVAPVRLLTYNVRSLRDDTAALVRVLRAHEPDVVCVQEAPRFLLSSWQLRRPARQAGLGYVCGGRSAAGPALLAAPEVRVRTRAAYRFAKAPGLHRRGVAVAQLEVGGVELTVASMHLGLRPDERVRNIADVAAVLAGSTTPLVLAGDVNEPPGGPAWEALAALGLRDAYAVAPRGGELTFPAALPRRRIDGIFVGPGLEVVSCGVPTDLAGTDLTSATDHLPVLAVLTVD